MQRPSKRIQHSWRGLVRSLELRIHSLTKSDQAVGDGGAGETGDEAYGRKGEAFVHEGAEAGGEREGARLEHVRRRARREKAGEGSGGGEGGWGEEVHENEVENRTNNNGGEHEVKLIEAEVGASSHVAEDASTHADKLFHQDLEGKLRVRGNPRSPSFEKNPDKAGGIRWFWFVRKVTVAIAISTAASSVPRADGWVIGAGEGSEEGKGGGGGWAGAEGKGSGGEMGEEARGNGRVGEWGEAEMGSHGGRCELEVEGMGFVIRVLIQDEEKSCQAVFGPP